MQVLADMYMRFTQAITKYLEKHPRSLCENLGATLSITTANTLAIVKGGGGVWRSGGCCWWSLVPEVRRKSNKQSLAAGKAP